MKKTIHKCLKLFIYGIIAIVAYQLNPQHIFSKTHSTTGEYMPSENNEKRHYNRLRNEKSPYLLQHAENPVDWFPWGDEAFEKAFKENKPIFLSIGYSTCHWCHVMAHESFEDDEVAALLNETFICIKVDREERPDIDNIYMTVCQMMTGSGGWPLTVFMTPDKKPFYAGTYFPKESRFQRPGLLDLVPKIKTLWAQGQNEILKAADKITNQLQVISESKPNKELGLNTLDIAYGQLIENYDKQHGGFGNSPKFPSPQNLLFLLRYWNRKGEAAALQIVEKTLHEMRHGGIYDHLGYGFHRYSTDREWLVPHFEKMLYDQAMLSIAYTETFQATGDKDFANTAKEIFTYVMRDMTSPEGGFYSAEDADSEGVEGKFYLWTEMEIRKILKEAEADIAIKTFNVQKDGNFQEEMSNHNSGANILYMKKTFHEIASDEKLAEQDFNKSMDNIRTKLLEVRGKRVYPHKDDKILTDWNGLMIAALAKGARVFGEKKYEDAAINAANFVLKNMRRSDGRLLHRFRDGESAILSHIDDYVFFIWGLLELYETTFDIKYLQTALSLNTDMITHFWDTKSGGFFFTSDDGEKLLFRQKEIYDGAIPSGNSVAMLNLLKLARITANPDLEKMAMKISTAFSDNISKYPSSYAQLMVALDFGFGPSYELVIAGKEGTDDTKDMLKSVRENFIPNKVVIFRPTDQKDPAISNIAAYTKDQLSINGKATAYVCTNYACKAPTAESDKMLELLNVKKIK